MVQRIWVCLKPATLIGEFENEINALRVNFGVQDQAILDIISGKTEPSGLLPFQMPMNMKTVENQFEDKPFEIEPYVDEEEHVYDFGYGLNWNGVIADERTRKYATDR